MNVEEDTKKHIALVASLLIHFAADILIRGIEHDKSKLESPEKEMFEIWRPKLDSLDINSQEYKDALVSMGEGLKHHYANNGHHPEHGANGIRDMSLIDVAEMVCDWIAAAHRNGKRVDMAWASKRFGIREDDMLYSVIENTVKKYEGMR